MSDALHIQSRNVIVVILLSWLLLVAASILQDLVLLSTGTDTKVWLLDVDSEDSLYTWFSTILLAGAGLLAFALAASGQDAGKWRAIGLIFLAMSLDEMLSLHEKLSGILSDALPTSGLFFFAWVIPAAIIVVIVAVVFLPFVLRLPRRVAALFLIASVVFVTGALGLEMASGAVLSGEEDLTSALQSPVYRIMTNVEEGLEGLGVILFIAALLARCAQVFPASFSTARLSTRAPIQTMRADVSATSVVPGGGQ